MENTKGFGFKCQSSGGRTQKRGTGLFCKGEFTETTQYTNKPEITALFSGNQRTGLTRITGGTNFLSKKGKGDSILRCEHFTS